MMFVFFHLTFPSIIPSRSRWTFVTSGKISSFIMAQYFSIVDPHSIFFIHSLINRHLGYFYTFAIITNATVNTSMQISASSQCFGLFFFFLRGLNTERWNWWIPLENRMATYSSTLAWRISWIEKPGRLQSMDSQSRTHLND